MDILTPLQQSVLNAFFSVPELKNQFYLTGGTALSAFYLKHRISVDLDFFTHDADLSRVERDVEAILTQAGLKVKKESGSPTFRRYRVNQELQIDLVRDVPFRIGVPELKKNVMVDNLQNIAVNKVNAIYGRLDPKDYVDLYFLKPILKFNILELLELAKKKDSGIDPFQWSKIIQDVNTFSVLPKMVKPLTLENLISLFKGLQNEIIDHLKPKQ